MADLVGVNGDRKEFKVVGKPNLPGKLSYSLATGKAKFGSDYVFPNMFFAKFLRSPYANAMVKSVDVAAAKKIPGVVDVVTWEDEDLKNFGRRGGGMMGGGAPKPGRWRCERSGREESGIRVRRRPVAFGPPAAGLGTGTTQLSNRPEARPESKARGGGMGIGGPQSAYVDQVADMEDDEVAVIVVAESEESATRH